MTLLILQINIEFIVKIMMIDSLFKEMNVIGMKIVNIIVKIGIVLMELDICISKIDKLNDIWVLMDLLFMVCQIIHHQELDGF
jgi:hypothetical protein